MDRARRPDGPEIEDHRAREWRRRYHESVCDVSERPREPGPEIEPISARSGGKISHQRQTVARESATGRLDNRRAKGETAAEEGSDRTGRG